MTKATILRLLAVLTASAATLTHAMAHPGHGQGHHLHLEEVAQAWYQTITIPVLALGVVVSIGAAAYLALRPARRRRVNPSGDAS
ncbi:MAG: hypothetical protein ACE360_04505 [Hyphomicrobiales bacterium]